MGAVGYIRVSTQDQAERGVSLDAQRARLAEWCAREGHELTAVHADAGISGGADLDKRPGLLAALDDLGRGDVLVVVKRDRLARDVFLSAMIERLAAKAGATVVACEGAGNGDSPEDQLMRRLVDAFAEYERQIIRARTKAAMAHLRAQGRHTGGHAPYGYRADAGGQLVEDSYEQGVIREARRLYRPGRVGLKRVAQHLNEQGYTSRGRRPFQATQVRAMVKEGTVR